MIRPDQLKRKWDDYDAYLFDIDGTLLTCTDAVHYFAFCETLTRLAKRPLNLDGVTAHGNTDVGILRDALQLARIPESTWRPQLKEAKKAMCAFVELQKHSLCAATLPHVPEVLTHLGERGAILGVATGNLQVIGQLKLQHCNLSGYFDFGGYSDDFEYRVDVFRAALEQARAVAGHAAAVCVVGDTPSDVRAAKANGLAVIAVATGVYSFAQLAAEEPTFCALTLRELLTPAV